MSVSFVNAAGAGNASLGTTLTIAKPSGVVDGDVLVCGIVVHSGTAPSTLSGWTPIQSTAFGASTIATFYKVASSEGASYAWTTPNVVSAGIIAAYRGANPLGPLDTSQQAANLANTTITGNGITTANNNEQVIWFGANDGDAVATTFAVPSAMTSRLQQGSGSGTNYTICVGDATLAVAGFTGSTLTNGSQTHSIANAVNNLALIPGAIAGSQMFFGSV